MQQLKQIYRSNLTIYIFTKVPLPAPTSDSNSNAREFHYYSLLSQ